MPGLSGLWDMHGGQEEWVHDCYVERASDFLTDPLGPENGGPRVHRGGSWWSRARYLRCASRFPRAADTENRHMSFRVVRVPGL
ncbi:MAG: formylglycine-generating enzyme family protein [Planctomycetaceae bacterium]